MADPTFDTVVPLASTDGEWRIAARMWTAILRLDVDAAAHLLRIEDGTLVSHSTCAASDAAAAPYTVRVAATGADWSELLAAVPRPYYQDLYGAMTRHGFVVDGEVETFFAYYPAVRRLVELLRAAQPREGTA